MRKKREKGGARRARSAKRQHITSHTQDEHNFQVLAGDGDRGGAIVYRRGLNDRGDQSERHDARCARLQSGRGSWREEGKTQSTKARQGEARRGEMQAGAGEEKRRYTRRREGGGPGGGARTQAGAGLGWMGGGSALVTPARSAPCPRQSGVVARYVMAVAAPAAAPRHPAVRGAWIWGERGLFAGATCCGAAPMGSVRMIAAVS